MFYAIIFCFCFYAIICLPSKEEAVTYHVGMESSLMRFTKSLELGNMSLYLWNATIQICSSAQECGAIELLNYSTDFAEDISAIADVRADVEPNEKLISYFDKAMIALMFWDVFSTIATLGAAAPEDAAVTAAEYGAKKAAELALKSGTRKLAQLAIFKEIKSSSCQMLERSFLKSASEKVVLRFRSFFRGLKETIDVLDANLQYLKEVFGFSRKAPKLLSTQEALQKIPNKDELAKQLGFTIESREGVCVSVDLASTLNKYKVEIWPRTQRALTAVLRVKKDIDVIRGEGSFKCTLVLGWFYDTAIGWLHDDIKHVLMLVRVSVRLISSSMLNSWVNASRKFIIPRALRELFNQDSTMRYVCLDKTNTSLGKKD
eukprot:TRINITY_DN40487_c0_g1_i1.p1 TRINITY_DN40487_c0_g1~~TRINITY_DN40487_c0_g1_i1.p1  ORF type:complete len:437 (-),score=48.60 TRINITY_DN40487_c0_g1_i1:131-1255(-)